MKGICGFYRNFAEEVVDRTTLFCRLIGGPAAGEIIQIRSGRDVIYIPIRSNMSPPSIKLDEQSNVPIPKFAQAKYVRSDFLPTLFYYEDVNES